MNTPAAIDGTLSERLNNDIKDAMIKKEKERLEALRYLKAMLIENKTSKSPIPEMDVLIKHVKKLGDSLGNFPPDNEIRLKTEREIQSLKVYMPKELSENDVQNIIQSIIKDLQGKGLPSINQGMVMKELTPKIKGQFDGKKASEMVIKSLA